MTLKRGIFGGRYFRRVLLVFILFCFGFTATGCWIHPEQQEAITLVNQTRSQYGLQPVTENLGLDKKAHEWAEVLASECSLRHSVLSDGAPSSWLKLGENVGYGISVSQIHTAYMASPGHRANILDPSFNRIGIGHVVTNCNGGTRVYTVQVFMKE